MDFRLFLILFMNIGLISAGEWSDSVFTIPNEFPCGDETDCPNWKYTPEMLLNTAYIKFKEELKEPILIAYLHCTDCSGENESPQIGGFEIGTRTTLGPEVKKVSEGIYSLTITNRLDYETVDQKEFKFSILLNGAKKTVKVKIDLLDIDDNPPIVTVDHTPCIIEENFHGKTDCIFSIKDPDEINKVSTIILSIPDEYEEHFEMILEEKNDNEAIAILKVRKENPLDFEKMPMYFFELTAKDLGENTGTSFVTITVEDVNDQPPRWIDIFAMKSFNENSEQEFTVSAKDGDLGINDEIIYKWKDDKCHESITLIPIGKEAKIKIDPINRDTQEMEDNDNTIKCTLIASEKSSNEFNTPTEISFIIQDINDNQPLITLDPKYEQLIKLREEELITLDKIFRIDDIDQGSNAQFDVTLQNTAGATIKTDYTKPFQVIPNNGYKKWDFSISVIDKIDYDRTKDWRQFSLTIHSKDKGDKPMDDEKTIKIELMNLNDEIPEFDKNTIYSVDINEDAKKGAYILNVLATDADEDDYITYDISEETDYELSLQDNKSATIYTNSDNVFDYEKVKFVYIQISATDNLIIPGEVNIPHTVTQQIKVNVKDVNDEKPIINLPSETDPIEEHSDINTEVTTKISAKDVDTTAHLIFTIDWENSKASKSGVQKTDLNLFKDVFSIETKYPDNKKKGQAVGILKVQNNETLDYEEFDTIFLNIKVTDIDQPEPGNTDEGTLTISIGDKNDNAPEFKQETIESSKVVEEHSKSQFRIGQIVAFDIDGPGNNDVTYKLEPRKGTEPGLVKIDSETGDLFVDTSEKIDADYPDPIEYLYYTVTASDNNNIHSTSRDIEIKVEDINDKIPFLKKELVDDSIKERKSTDVKECLKQKIQGHDDDRDDPHNKVKYYINNEINPQLSQMFEIHPDNGEVCARGDIEWKSNQKDIKVYIILEDNYKGSGVPNTHKVNFTVKITDIDNNPPVLPDENTFNVMENIKVDEEIAKFIATDEDEPCTETTKIKYMIEEVKHNRGKEISADFFLLSTEEGPPPKCEQIAILKVAKSLKDYYGKITVTIGAQNVVNTNNYAKKSYEINVNPYNYKPPVIRIPNKSTLILKKEQEANKQLKYIDGTSVEDFEADDDQGGKFEMSFKPGKIWDDNFKLLFPNPDGEKNKARLTLINTDLDPKDDYTLQIIAYHSGEGSKSDVEKTITVKFVDSDQLPGFIEVEDTVEFWENSIKPDNECQPFQEATEPKCFENEECTYEIVYHIINVEEKKYFRTEKGTPPKLCLNVALDREDQAYHNLIIVATNNDVAPSKVPEDYTPLNLTVIVKDVNDNPPAFDTKLFKGGLSDTQKIDSVIVTLKASDPDEVDQNKLTYKIEEISVSDPSLTKVKDSAFKLEKDEIKNLIQPTQVMKGHFLFKVRVFDSFETLKHSDTAEVKIHVISDANRVIFEFSDDIDAVKLKEEEIREIFTKQFGYTCIIDDIAKIVNDTTRETTYITEVKTHFIDESIDEPVDKEVITTKLEDLAIVGRLQSRLEDIDLTLISIENNENEVTNEMEDMNYLLKILLIVVSVVLGTLCIILIIAFILRSRSLNKRLEAMTTNVFGSTKSDLNRIGTSAPGTNRHAIEANPISNEELNNIYQFDTISQASGGSDLIGVEDRPDFAYDIRRASINPIIQQNLHNMAQQDDDINSLPGFNNNSGIDNKSYGEYDFRRTSINPVIQQDLHNMSEQNDDDDIHSLPGSNDRSRF